MATKLVPAGETVVDAEAEIAAEEVAGCEIETRVAGIVRDAQTEKITVGADAREIPGEIQIPSAIGGVQDEAAGIDRTAKKMIAGKLDGIEEIGRASCRERV